MATVNNRTGLPQAVTINGVDAGGAMQCRLQEGYEGIVRSGPDGLPGPPLIDRDIQFVRGTIVTQDWVEAINLLTGVVGTYVFSERKSGVAAATGYIKHTLTNPVIYRVRLSANKGQYATVAADFECRAASETATIADMHAVLDSQAAPTHITAARGGYRLTGGKFNTTPAIDIYHLTAADFTIEMPLVKECNDSDIAYTCVDARLDGMTAVGSITFQDSAIAAESATLVAQKLLLGARSSLEWRLTQSQGATAQDFTIAGVQFHLIAPIADSGRPFTEYACNFEVCQSVGTPLTLDGDNKLLTIAEAS